MKEEEDTWVRLMVFIVLAKESEQQGGRNFGRLAIALVLSLFHQSRQKNNKSHPKYRPSNANN